MKTKNTLLNILVILLIITPSFYSQKIWVPTDYPIIQDAINAAETGDTVLVDEGTYHQNINFKGKAITVASKFILEGDSLYKENTILDGISFSGDSSSLVYFVSGEGSNSILCGFTIQNGKGTYIYGDGWKGRGGGAIWIDKSGAQIRDNIIQDNNILKGTNSGIQAWGGGIECFDVPIDKNLIIKKNLFRNNSVSGDVAMGGAIDIYGTIGHVSITQNIIEDNYVASKQGGYGSGISIYEGPSENIYITNNLIKNNFVEAEWARGGGIAAENVYVQIYNNIINNNRSEKLRGTFGDATGGGISVRYYPGGTAAPKMKGIIINNTIIDNNAMTVGSGIFTRQIDTEIMNNIIRKNKDDANKQIYFDRTIGYSQEVSFSNIEGGFSGSFNIDVDPQFSDTIHCYLSDQFSKCIDAGNPISKYNDAEDPGKLGSPLYPALGSLTNDMGAYGGPNSKWDVVTDIQEESNLIPNISSISQNYPNPFNPSTVINYSISPQEIGSLPFVELIVFDVLGREVTKLVNQNQKPGNYKVEWSTKKQASGIYFYKLQAGDFVETKKMILLR